MNYELSIVLWVLYHIKCYISSEFQKNLRETQLDTKFRILDARYLDTSLDVAIYCTKFIYLYIGMITSHPAAPL
jgi:wobble nucleotide-excising tRNase